MDLWKNSFYCNTNLIFAIILGSSIDTGNVGKDTNVGKTTNMQLFRINGIFGRIKTFIP